MFPTKIDEIFFKKPNTVGIINSEPSLGAALKLPPGAVDVLELRLDGFAGTPDKLLKALPRLKAPLLITARHPKEGALAALTQKERAELFKRFMPHAALIDLEVRSLAPLKPILEEARHGGVKIVASFHDFKSTPSPERLLQMAGKAARAGADIFKVAATTRTAADIAKLLSLFSRAKLPLSVMGMGPFGKVSRLLFAQAGSVLNYGFLDANTQLSGQWPARVLRERILECADMSALV